MDKFILEAFKDTPELIIWLAFVFISLKFYEIYLKQRDKKDHVAIVARLTTFEGNFEIINTKIDSLLVKDDVASIIDNSIQHNLKYFKSSRMQSHLIMNGEMFVDFATHIINMNIETLSENEIDRLSAQAMQKNYNKKSKHTIDSFLNKDYMERTEGKTVQKYVANIKEIANSPHNTYAQRFARATVSAFDEVIDDMINQYDALIEEGFDFKDKELENLN